MLFLVQHTLKWLHLRQHKSMQIITNTELAEPWIGASVPLHVWWGSAQEWDCVQELRVRTCHLTTRRLLVAHPLPRGTFMKSPEKGFRTTYFQNSICKPQAHLCHLSQRFFLLASLQRFFLPAYKGYSQKNVKHLRVYYLWFSQPTIPFQLLFPHVHVFLPQIR